GAEWYKASEAKASNLRQFLGEQRKCMDGRPRLPSTRMTLSRHRVTPLFDDLIGSNEQARTSLSQYSAIYLMWYFSTFAPVMPSGLPGRLMIRESSCSVAFACELLRPTGR